jgi:hypothetical protein
MTPICAASALDGRNPVQVIGFGVQQIGTIRISFGMFC